MGQTIAPSLQLTMRPQLILSSSFSTIPVLQALILTETNWSLSDKLTTLTLVVNLSLRLALQQCLTKILAGLGDFPGYVTPNPHS